MSTGRLITDTLYTLNECMFSGMSHQETRGTHVGLLGEQHDTKKSPLDRGQESHSM